MGPGTFSIAIVEEQRREMLEVTAGCRGSSAEM
jgi:hypothetical protein